MRKKGVTIKAASILLAISMLASQLAVGSVSTYASEYGEVINQETDVYSSLDELTTNDNDDSTTDTSYESEEDSTIDAVIIENISSEDESLDASEDNDDSNSTDSPNDENLEEDDTEIAPEDSEDESAEIIDEDLSDEIETEEVTDDEIDITEEETVSEELLDASVQYKISVPSGHYVVGLNKTEMSTSLTTTVSNGETITLHFLADPGFVVTDLIANKPTVTGEKFTPMRGGMSSSGGPTIATFRFDTNLFDSDVTFTPKVVRNINITNTPGNYKIAVMHEANSADYSAEISNYVSDEAPLNFNILANDNYEVTKVTYQVKNGSKVAISPVSTNEQEYHYVIPAAKLTGNINIEVTTVRILFVTPDSGLTVKFLDSAVTADKNTKGKYRIDESKLGDKLRFNVICDATHYPTTSILYFDYSTFTYTSSGVYTYLYEVPVNLIPKDNLLVRSHNLLDRKVYIDCDLDEFASASIRIDGYEAWLRYESDSFVYAPAGKTIYLRFKPLSNVKIAKIKVTGKTTGAVKYLKYSKEIAFKPMEECTISFITNQYLQNVIIPGSFSAYPIRTLTPSNGIYTLSPYEKYSTLLLNGSSFAGECFESYYTEVYDGKINITDKVLTPVATSGHTKNEYNITNLEEYGGKTLIMKRYTPNKVPGKDKPDVTTKLKVLRSVNQIKAVTLNGKSQVSQYPGETVVYKIGLSPSDIDWDKISVSVPSSNKAVRVIRLNDRKDMIAVYLDPAYTSSSSFQYGELNIEYQIDSDTSQIINTPPLRIYSKSIIENVTPTVSVTYATERVIGLKLTLPKGVPERLTGLEYDISVDAVLEDGKTLAQNMISHKSVVVNCNSKTTYASVGLIADVNKPYDKYNVQKYKFTVTLRQNLLGMSKAYVSKSKIITASTQAKAAETKLNIKKVKTKFYSEEAAKISGVVIANVKFSSKTTIRSVICNINTRTTDGSTMVLYTRDHGDGTLDIVFQLSSSNGSGAYSLVPGNYAVTVSNAVSDTGAKEITKTIPITVLNPAAKIELKSNTIEKTVPGGKAFSIQPGIKMITDMNGNIVTKKPVEWSISNNLSSSQMEHVKLNKKTGKLTFDKDFVLSNKYPEIIKLTATVTELNSVEVSDTVEIILFP